MRKLIYLEFHCASKVSEVMSKKQIIRVLVLFSTMGTVYSDCGMIDASYLLTPKLISIEYIDGNTETGSEAIFSCPRGYELFGTSRTQCDGDWYVPEKPKCLEIVCPSPDEIQHGHLHIDINHTVAKNFTFGRAYSVRCDKGFIVLGYNIRTCMENGSWSREALECTEIKLGCDISRLTENGTVHLSTKTPLKHQHRKKREIPNCEPPTPKCPDITLNISNGHLKDLGETLNSKPVYHIECDDQFISDGSSVLICKADGNWTKIPPYCKPDLPIKATDSPIKPKAHIAAIIVMSILMIGIVIPAVITLVIVKHRFKQKDIAHTDEEAVRMTHCQKQNGMTQTDDEQAEYYTRYLINSENEDSANTLDRRGQAENERLSTPRVISESIQESIDKNQGNKILVSGSIKPIVCLNKANSIVETV